MSEPIVIPPPSPKIFDYPAATGIGIGIVFVTVLLIVSSKFDPTKGPLTISLLIIMAFIAACIFSLFYTIPTDEITSALLGGLVAAFGAVIAHWIGRGRNGS